jgi:HAD superfamily hydrolase (TIGR01509 family)
MIKLVLFDLDGVLINAKQIHFESLNEALGEYAITEEEHLTVYDGHKTRQKLQMLTELKGLPISMHDTVFRDKQEYTSKRINKLKGLQHVYDLVSHLKSEGYKIGVCTNSIRTTLHAALNATGLNKVIDLMLSNEHVQQAKPHPEIYWMAMSKLGALPEETIIIEDSPPGLLAAKRSGANVIRVKDPSEVTIDNIVPQITSEPIKLKWKDPKMNVLIPMAGAGNRFVEAGYSFPKPLIDVEGKPMIQLVVENIGIDANYIYVCQKEHRERFNLDTMMNLITSNNSIIDIAYVTEGAACTALLADELIDNDAPLFFANSDQYVEWDPVEFMYSMQESNCDGGIVTFKSTHPKWSFADVNEDGYVTQVAEKDPISDNATVGFYYWKKGSDFVKYARQMIEANFRTNGEFYVCPVFNLAIRDGKKIKAYHIDEMWGLGTPEDLERYLNR